MPADLWTVVRDLWSLRLSRLLHKLEQPPGDDDTDTQGISSRVNSLDESDGDGEVRNPKLASSSPSLIDTVSLCYMGMLLLRLPISLSQMLRWVLEERIPYIRAIRHVPADMKDKLPGEYHEALDTSSILRPEVLQKGVSNLSAMYYRSYGMKIPTLNSPIVLYHYIEGLSLSLEVYAAVKHLNGIVGFKFEYPELVGTRRRAISYPEAQLMSLVVIATKLLFPFNSDLMRRNPRNAIEQEMASIDWGTWAEGPKALKDVGRSKDSLNDGTEINIKDTDVFEMSSSQLDQYMNWYQRTWSKTESADDVRKELLDMFPFKMILPKHIDSAKVLQEEETRLQNVQHVQARLKTREVVTDEQAQESATEIIRYGMRYQQFRDQKALSLSPIAMTFHEEAAKLSCLSVDMLLRAILQTERKITLWRRAKKRAERFGEDMNLAAENALPPGLEGLDQMTLAEAAVDLEAATSDVQEAASDSASTDINMRMIE